MKPWEELRATDLMKSPVLCVESDCPLGEAARRMAESQVSGLLVTGQSGAAVGVISLSDIVSYLAGLERSVGEPGGFYRLGQPDFEAAGPDEVKELPKSGEDEEEPLWETTVDELMSEDIITVPPTSTVPEIAKILWDRRIHRVFVEGPNGPDGVISTMDILGALTGLPLSKAEA